MIFYFEKNGQFPLDLNNLKKSYMEKLPMRQAFHEIGISPLVIELDREETGIQRKKPSPTDPRELINTLEHVPLQSFEPTFIRVIPPIFESKNDPVSGLFFFKFFINFFSKFSR